MATEIENFCEMWEQARSIADAMGEGCPQYAVAAIFTELARRDWDRKFTKG